MYLRRLLHGEHDKASLFQVVPCYAYMHEYYTDIDRDGHAISRFGGLPRELYFPKGLYCPEGKYNYLGTTDT